MQLSTMASAIEPSDFSNSTSDPLRDRWTTGKLRHVIAAARGHKAIVTIEDLAYVDVELVGLYDASLARLVVRYQWGAGEGEHTDTRYLLHGIGPIVVLGSTNAKWTALETHRNEVSAAIEVAREAHGEAEGRAWGAWSGDLTFYGAAVRYRPSTGNPHYAEKAGPAGAWTLRREDYADRIRPTSAEIAAETAAAEVDEGLVDCPKGCGLQQVTDSGSNSGFAGEGVSWTNLACGHADVETGDPMPYIR